MATWAISSWLWNVIAMLLFSTCEMLWWVWFIAVEHRFCFYMTDCHPCCHEALEYNIYSMFLHSLMDVISTTSPINRLHVWGVKIKKKEGATLNWNASSVRLVFKKCAMAAKQLVSHLKRCLSPFLRPHFLGMRVCDCLSIEASCVFFFSPCYVHGSGDGNVDPLLCSKLKYLINFWVRSLSVKSPISLQTTVFKYGCYRHRYLVCFFCFDHIWTRGWSWWGYCILIGHGMAETCQLQGIYTLTHTLLYHLFYS